MDAYVLRAIPADFSRLRANHRETRAIRRELNDSAATGGEIRGGFAGAAMLLAAVGLYCALALQHRPTQARDRSPNGAGRTAPHSALAGAGAGARHEIGTAGDDDWHSGCPRSYSPRARSALRNPTIGPSNKWHRFVSCWGYHG